MRGFHSTAGLAAGLLLAIVTPGATAAQTVGAIAAGGSVCRPLEIECSGDASCTGLDERCVALTVGGRLERRCLREGAALCCLRGALGCPDGRRCAYGVLRSVVGLCLRTDEAACLGAVPAVDDALRCHTAPDGTSPVSWAKGDCDGDGATNREEQEAGGLPCPEPPDPGVDAGVAPGDGGVPPVPDAGVPRDAGAFDAAPAPPAPIVPRFEGGGGCAATPGGGRAGWLLLLALLVIRARGCFRRPCRRRRWASEPRARAGPGDGCPAPARATLRGPARRGRHR